jgi:hypothetical protein
MNQASGAVTPPDISGCLEKTQIAALIVYSSPTR